MYAEVFLSTEKHNPGKEKTMKRFFLALVGLVLLPFFAEIVLAQVDLRDTDCPNCAPKLLRDPEPQTTKEPDPVEKGQEQGQRDMEDFQQEKSRQDAEKNENEDK
jgi:hypothetical protein